jgi:hypothetical protein
VVMFKTIYVYKKREREMTWCRIGKPIYIIARSTHM